MSTTVGSGYHSELFRRLYAQAEARCVLTVLDSRGVQVSEAVREQILTCTDHDQLDTWLRRASTATAAYQVTRPPITTTAPTFYSEKFRQLYAEAEARAKERAKERGVLQGTAGSVLIVLDVRGVPVPEAIREQMLACTDLDQLNTWLKRAVTAATAEEVTRP
ncbi:hypothetical protein O7627_02675 [Solwaraspora sp. WMMD1047]|uniref:hypothetical protein n=1 Tax=Solwaraspora sp. WMMD1047 TaxID=3016102 RepID=UPI0024180556|nr:hypothetical protein [Solwaraspora sp. WMMD1047]MDG4828208.1 hypothetical protein [Solwaraspora sp. WMMD1047]